jgi:hypothetical protein
MNLSPQILVPRLAAKANRYVRYYFNKNLNLVECEYLL